jgi:hypothetical protein
MPLERMAHVRPTAVAVVALFSLVLVLAGCGANAPIQSASVGSAPPAAASPSAATTTPSAAAASPVVSATFTSDAFAVPVSFSLAGGWTVTTDVHSIIDLRGPDLGTGLLNSQNAGIMDIGSTTVAGATQGDPYMPWPKDLYAWLKSRPEFKPQAPQAITVGGRPATQIDADASVPANTTIELVCSKDSSCWLLDHSDRWRFVEVKNTDGSGVVWITNGIPAPGFDSFAQALDKLLGTLAFR